MARITGYALDGSLVSVEHEDIRALKEVSTEKLLGKDAWLKQSVEWRKANLVTTVAYTKIPPLGEIWFAAPFIKVAYAITQAGSSLNSDSYIMILTGQAYDSPELEALIEGDQETIKDKDLEPRLCSSVAHGG